jgi:hypothetical protein
MTCGEKNPSTPPALKGGMNADEIRSNLEALAKELGSTGEEVPVVIVGGALMAFRNFRESTTDIDTVSSIGPELSAAIERVATSRDLPKHWLNQSAKAFAPNTLLEAEQHVVLKRGRLKVLGVSNELLFLMKLNSNRQRDHDDLLRIWPMTSFMSADHVLRDYYTAYPMSKHDPYLLNWLEDFIKTAEQNK